VSSAQQQLNTLREQTAAESSLQATVLKESTETTVGSAQQLLISLRDQLAEESARHAATVHDAAVASVEESQRQFGALRHEADEKHRELESKLTQARESAAQLDNFSSRIGVAQQQALSGFESQLDDILSLHRNELHRRSDALFEELNQRLRSTFEHSSHD